MKGTHGSDLLAIQLSTAIRLRSIAEESTLLERYLVVLWYCWVGWPVPFLFTPSSAAGTNLLLGG